MDKSLDEIITTNKTSKRGGAAGGAKRTGGRRGAGGGAGGAARAQVLGSRPGPTPAQRVRAAAASATGALAQGGGRTTRAAAAAGGAVGGVATNTEKIIVSNLPLDVNEPNLREFFVQMVGPVSSVNLSYDSKAKSKGVATVVFSRKGDANKAFKEFNNRLIDSSRPMRIELVVDPSKPLPLSSRVAPPAAATTTAGAKTQGAPAGRPARGGKRRGGAAGGGGGGERAKRTPKTAADLDAEMEDYSAAGATTTTVAPTAAAAPAA